MTYQNQDWQIIEKFRSVDNFLDIDKQKELLQLFLHPRFPWALTLNAVNGVDTDLVIHDNSIIGMYHTFVYNGQVCSPFYQDIKFILEYFDKINLNKQNIIRIRAGLFLKNPDDTPHVPHIDAKIPHTTAVYYVNDCDGDLVIYKETYKSHPWKAPEFPTEHHRFVPGQNKLAIFDGQYYHSSSYPTQKPLRLAITFNFQE